MDLSVLTAVIIAGAFLLFGAADVKAAVNAAKEVSPPAIVSGATILGLELQHWVYVVTIVYTLIQILRTFPKIIGCGVCFYKHGTCTLQCKSKPISEEENA